MLLHTSKSTIQYYNVTTLLVQLVNFRWNLSRKLIILLLLLLGTTKTNSMDGGMLTIVSCISSSKYFTSNATPIAWHVESVCTRFIIYYLYTHGNSYLARRQHALWLVQGDPSHPHLQQQQTETAKLRQFSQIETESKRQFAAFSLRGDFKLSPSFNGRKLLGAHLLLLPWPPPPPVSIYIVYSKQTMTIMFNIFTAPRQQCNTSPAKTKE